MPKAIGKPALHQQAECTDLPSQPTGKNNRREIAEGDRTT